MMTSSSCAAWSAAAVLLALPAAANAAATHDFKGPFQFSATFDQQLLMSDGVYRRETFPFVGGTLWVTVSDKMRPSPGDTWDQVLEITSPDGTVSRFSALAMVYDASLDCFTIGGSAVFCNVYANADKKFTTTYGLTVVHDAQCLLDTDSQGRPFAYHVVGNFLAGGGTVSIGRFPFDPTPFPVGVPEVSVSKMGLHPETTRPTIAAEGADVTIVVRDGIVRHTGGNCGILLRDIPLAIRSTVVPNTGSHRHFTNPEEPGTGEFFTSPPQVVGPDGTTVSGHTDVNGQLITRYEAGVFGVAERIRVKATDQHYGRTRENETDLTIRVPGLVPLDTGNAFYSLRGTFSSPCDVQHNDGATQRRSHYVTPAMRDLVGTMAGRFFSTEGFRLSLNDASLEFGGFFDDGVRDARCHFLHQHGMDIDVNVDAPEYSACAGSSGLRCPATNPEFTGFTRRRALSAIAWGLGGTPEPEATLHYRFRSAQN